MGFIIRDNGVNGKPINHPEAGFIRIKPDGMVQVIPKWLVLGWFTIWVHRIIIDGMLHTNWGYSL